MPNMYRANPLYEPYKGGGAAAAPPPPHKQEAKEDQQFYSYIQSNDSNPSSPLPSANVGSYEVLTPSYQHHRPSFAPELPPRPPSLLAESGEQSTRTTSQSTYYDADSLPAPASSSSTSSTYYDADDVHVPPSTSTPAFALASASASTSTYYDADPVPAAMSPSVALDPKASSGNTSSHVYTLPNQRSTSEPPPIPQRPLPATPSAIAITPVSLSTSPPASTRVNVGRGSLPAITPADYMFEDDDGLPCSANGKTNAFPDWFHPGNISREEAETRLRYAQRHAQHGTTMPAPAGMATKATVWLVRQKREERETYVLSVLARETGCGGGQEQGQGQGRGRGQGQGNEDERNSACDHYLLSRSVRADGSHGAHWIVNSAVRLVMCRSINEIIRVLQNCPFTSKRVCRTANANTDLEGPLLHPRGCVVYTHKLAMRSKATVVETGRRGGDAVSPPPPPLPPSSRSQQRHAVAHTHVKMDNIYGDESLVSAVSRVQSEGLPAVYLVGAGDGLQSGGGQCVAGSGRARSSDSTSGTSAHPGEHAVSG